VLRLAVLTNNFEDIEQYYKVFTDIDDRQENSFDTSAQPSSFAVSSISGRETQPELCCSSKASMYSAERPHILREIISTLLAAGLRPRPPAT